MKKTYSDHSKNFFGIVKEVIDETFVRVFIFGVHPLDQSKVDISDLPKAQVLYPTTGGQAGSGSIQHNLEVDSWVYGFAVDEMWTQLFIISAVQGTMYSMSTYDSNGGEFIGDGGGDIDITETTNIPGGSNIEKSYNYVYEKLLREGSSSDPHLHASACLGVLLLETSGINPAVVGGYKGRAWGICQWLGSRRKQLFAKFGRTKRLDQQLDFMWWELNNTEKSAKRKWLSATNLEDATAGFAAFERAEEWDLKRGVIIRSHPNFKKRLRYAYQIYNSASYTGATS